MILETLLAAKRILSSGELADLLHRPVVEVDRDCEMLEAHGYLMGDARGWELTGSGARVAGAARKDL